MKNERNPNIELWRCLCMFAVVLGHVLANNHICSMDAFRWHIPGFLLISGYFGVRLSFKKMVKLISTAYLCYWLTIPFREWTGIGTLLLPHGGWFLPFYCVLMLMSPLLNAALENTKVHRLIVCSIVALMIIGWLPTLTTNVHARMIAIPGMQGNGLLLMVTTYVVGALLRGYKIEKKHNSAVWLLLFVIGIAICMGVGRLIPTSSYYGSPLSLLTAAAGLMWFVSAPQLPTSVGRIVNIISPSMFGVYLLHECCIRQYQSVTGGVVAAVTRSILLFVACIGIDMIRRAIVSGAGYCVLRFRHAK